MGMYDQFATNKDLETKGIVLDYDEFRVRVARAGGSNKKFQRIFEAKTKPHRFAMNNGTMSDKQSEAIFHEVFAEACILNWEVKTDEVDESGEPVYRTGIEAPNGEIVDVNVDNITMTFRNLPDLFMDIKDQCTSAGLFRQQLLEEDVKN